MGHQQLFNLVALLTFPAALCSDCSIHKIIKLGYFLIPVKPPKETLLLYQLERWPHTDWHTMTTLFQHNYRLIPQMARWSRRRPKCLSAQSEVVTGSGGVWSREILPYYLCVHFLEQDNKSVPRVSLSNWHSCILWFCKVIRSLPLCLFILRACFKLPDTDFWFSLQMSDPVIQ